MLTDLKNKAIDLLKVLIEIPSISKEENKTADALVFFLKQEGLEVQRIGNNVYAYHPFVEERKPTILLNSHHDTVKPNAQYTLDPFKAIVNENTLYGLGSNDAGASLVSLLASFLYFKDRTDLKFNLLLLLSAEEEISGKNGVELVLPKLGKIDFGIVGEPTQMKMAIAEKGLMVLDAKAKGLAGHAAREEGLNAISIAMKDIEWFHTYKFPKVSDTLGEVKMTVTMINAGTQHNVIPDTCSYTVDVRNTDAYSNEEVLNIIRAHTLSEINPRSMRLNSSGISKNHVLLKAAEKLNIPFYGSPTLSDQALMNFPTVKIGPGDSARSHTANEYSLLSEIENGIDTYLQLLNELNTIFMKLWQKSKIESSSEKQKRVEAFTVGSDKHWDVLLASADVQGSVAHAKMLYKIGLLTEVELNELLDGLAHIQLLIEKNEFEIQEDIEDVHSQIEYLLTEMKGEVGKKIHSGRSRNDQSLLDIKLYLKSEIKNIATLVEKLFGKLLQLSETHKDDLLPGYTHQQLGMPSSFGLWFAAYAESLSDDLELLIAAYHVANKNPLGSAAGYGSSFPLDRAYTTELLGFESLNVNAVYAQMTRGKTEKIVSFALASIAASLNKLSTDICLYVNQQYNFISFPTELCTGSSIMPHKKNPDVFELIRAKSNKIQSLPTQLTMLLNNLSSGYHRDLQLTKECLFPNIEELKECIDMMCFMLEDIEVKKDILKEDKYNYLFTVEELNKLVLAGIPFREAYQKIASDVEAGVFNSDRKLQHTHIGSMGQLGNDLIAKKFKEKLAEFLN